MPEHSLPLQNLKSSDGRREMLLMVAVVVMKIMVIEKQVLVNVTYNTSAKQQPIPF